MTALTGVTPKLCNSAAAFIWVVTPELACSMALLLESAVETVKELVSAVVLGLMSAATVTSMFVPILVKAPDVKALGISMVGGAVAETMQPVWATVELSWPKVIEQVDKLEEAMDISAGNLISILPFWGIYFYGVSLMV